MALTSHGYCQEDMRQHLQSAHADMQSQYRVPRSELQQPQGIASYRLAGLQLSAN